MNCLICNESSEKSLCDNCSHEKRCKECNSMKNCNTFYSYKNGKMYSTCIQCFIKKVRCEFCNKELNKCYLRFHIKKQHVPQHYNQDDKHIASHNDEYHTNINTGGDLVPTQVSTELRDGYRTPNNNNNNNNKDSQTLYGAKTVIFGLAMERLRLSLAHCVFWLNQNQPNGCFTLRQLLEYVVGIDKFTIANDFRWIVAPESGDLDANIFSKKENYNRTLYTTQA